MLRPEYLRRLVDAAHVDVFLSANCGRLRWPWKMQPVHEADSRHRNSCDCYIVDSSFKDDSITNADVLDTAHRLGADVAVLADVYQDKAATVEAIREGLAAADGHAYDGDLMIPLQAPHADCYAELAGRDAMYAIGGVKDKPDAAKIQAIRDVRDAAGTDVHLHGLGVGVSDRLVDAVQDDPGLIDSIDYSTPIQNAMHNDAAPGDEIMSVIATRAAATLVEDLRKLTPYPTDDAQPTQTTLAEVTNDA